MQDRARFKAYITKYALSNGITEIDAEDCFYISPDMIKDAHQSAAYHANEWHRTLEAAQQRAEQMRVAKISSLRKQIAKLEKLRF